MDTTTRSGTPTVQRRGQRGSRPRLLGGAKTLCFAAALVLLPSGSALAQNVVSGQVTALDTGEPLAGVQVQVSGTTVGTITDNEGRYTLTAPSAEGTLTFTRIGSEYMQLPVRFRETRHVHNPRREDEHHV